MAFNTASASGLADRWTVLWNRAVELTEPFYPEVTLRVPSSRRDEPYLALGDIPAVREYWGDRVAHRIATSDYRLKNRNWELTLAFEKFDLDDGIGFQLDQMIQNMSADFRQHPDDLFFAKLAQGTSSLGWDGVNFFSTSHVWGMSGTHSNLVTLTGVLPLPDGTNAATRREMMKYWFQQLWQKMVSYKTDTGKYMMRTTLRNFNNLILMVPPQMLQAAVDAFTLTTEVTGGQQMVVDAPRIRTSPELTGTTDIYLFAASRGPGLRPFIFQDRMPARFQTKNMDNDWSKDMEAGGIARYEVGYGIWQAAVKGIGTES